MDTTLDFNKLNNSANQNIGFSQKPLKVLIATSVRDVGGEDRVGSFLTINQQYMEGTSEYLLQQTNKPDSNIEIVGIVFDDTPSDAKKLKGYSLSPQKGRSWVLPNIERYRGTPVKNLIRHIPSTFRSLPINHVTERAALKKDFEYAVYHYANQVQADVILSDHLMLKLEHLHHLIPTINIHPAITDTTHIDCRRGKTPTADTLLAAQSQDITFTGATLHFVGDIIDDGTPITEVSNVVVNPQWTPEELRWHNYRKAKNPIALKGLQHLYENFDETIENQPSLDLVAL